MGVVYFPLEGEEIGELIKKADIAMYHAKKSGKNKMVVYQGQSEKTEEKNEELQGDF